MLFNSTEFKEERSWLLFFSIMLRQYALWIGVSQRVTSISESLGIVFSTSLFTLLIKYGFNVTFSSSISSAVFKFPNFYLKTSIELNLFGSITFKRPNISDVLFWIGVPESKSILVQGNSFRVREIFEVVFFILCASSITICWNAIFWKISISEVKT